MALTSGFFESVGGDRLYTANQMSRIFEGVFEDGIFPTVGNKFAVTTSGTNMSVNVGTGKAWFNNTWTFNDAPVNVLIEAAEPILNRIDVLVLEVNTHPLARINSLKVIKGTPAATPVAPALTNSGWIRQHALAHLTITHAMTAMFSVNIISKIGTVDCPYVAGILDPLAITADSVTTLTNKKIVPRIGGLTTGTSPVSPAMDLYDFIFYSAQATALTINNPNGTAVQGQTFILRLKDNGTARALTWGSAYRGIGTTLPATTVANKTTYLGFIYNATDLKWDLIALALEV